MDEEKRAKTFVLSLMNERKVRVLFVCLGNICRSPAAEGAFQQLIESQSLQNKFEIDSCGTSQYHIGSLPDPRTREVAKKRGIILKHKARQFRNSDFDTFDFILAMDQKNLDDILQRTPLDAHSKKVSLFAKFASVPGETLLEVPDPYYGTLEDFESVQDLVENSSLGFLEFLKKEGLISIVS